MVFVKNDSRGRNPREGGFFVVKLQAHADRKTAEGVHQADGESQIANLAGAKVGRQRQTGGLAVHALNDWRMDSRREGGMSFTNLASADMAKNVVRQLRLALFTQG